MDLTCDGWHRRPPHLQSGESHKIPCMSGVVSRSNNSAGTINLIPAALPHSNHNHADHLNISDHSKNQYDDELDLRMFQDGSIGYIPPAIGAHNVFNSGKFIDRKTYTCDVRPRDGTVNKDKSSMTGGHSRINSSYYASESIRDYYTNTSTNVYFGTLSSGLMAPSARLQTSVRAKTNSELHELSAMNLSSFELPAEPSPHEGYIPAASTDFPVVQHTLNSTSNQPLETFHTGHTPEYHSEPNTDASNVQQEQNTVLTGLFVSESGSMPADDDIPDNTSRINLPQSASPASDERIAHNADVYAGFTSRNTVIPVQNPSGTGYHHGPIPDPNPGWQIPDPAEFGRREGRNTMKWLKRPESQPPNPRVKLSNLNTLVCDVVVHTWPEGVILCGRTYNSNGALMTHMRACHASAIEPESARKQPTASERAAGQAAIQEWVLTRKWRNANYAFEPMNPAKSLCSHYAELFEARARRDSLFAREFGQYFHRQYDLKTGSNKPQFTTSYIWEATVDRRASSGASGTNSSFAVNSNIPNMSAFPRGTFDQSVDDERELSVGDDRNNNDSDDAVVDNSGDDEGQGATCERIIEETTQSMDTVAITEANIERAKRREAALKEDQRIRRILEAETINERNNDRSETEVAVIQNLENRTEGALTQNLRRQEPDAKHQTMTEDRLNVFDAGSRANGEAMLNGNEARIIGDLFDDDTDSDDDDDDNDDDDAVNKNGNGANYNDDNANDGNNKGNDNDNDEDKNDNEDDKSGHET